ncbi:hypothetical protein BDB00DRAFT_877644 [Zychaea mexicana]|uniref:uncharacterized protein n=1 Tax=Zychaea mexicana TaxID=64656 RepID=UPI0022FEF897|nr:uncharacterized protein BDB00DRAFT_877644 [Zychaea mexicana]KAI9488259.1 hypothetical protein BDB00DRAFT_877644 [Zychaea mexicana]
MWTESDKRIVIKAKGEKPNCAWEKIALSIKHRHSAEGCRKMYDRDRFDSKPKTPLSLPERRQVAKMRQREPPTAWRKVSATVGHSTKVCQDLIKNHATDKELKRGRREALSEKQCKEKEAEKAQKKKEGARKGDDNKEYETKRSSVALSAPSTKKKIRNSSSSEAAATKSSSKASSSPSTGAAAKKVTTVKKRWTDEEQTKLIHHRRDGKLAWKDIARDLGRTVPSCQSKHQRVKNWLLEHPRNHN